MPSMKSNIYEYVTGSCNRIDNAGNIRRKHMCIDLNVSRETLQIDTVNPNLDSHVYLAEKPYIDSFSSFQTDFTDTDTNGTTHGRKKPLILFKYLLNDF